MFNWLRKLTNSKNSKEIKSKKSSTEKKALDMPPQPLREADVRPNNPKEKEPIYVRGRYWKNTEEDRWELPDDLDTLHGSTIEELIGELERIDRAEIRRAAAENLEQLGSTANSAIPTLMKTAVDKDKTVRAASLNALHAIDPNWPQNNLTQQAVPCLVAALKNQPSDVIAATTDLLIQIGPATVPNLANEILGEDSIGNVFVLRVLAQVNLGSINIIPELITALESQHAQVRIAAAETLAIIGPTEETIPILTAGLADPFPNVREAMATSLGQAGTIAEPALPAMLPLLADRKREVRNAAAEATSLIGPEAVPALTELVSTHDLERFKAWLQAKQKVSKWFLNACYRYQENLVTDPYKSWMNLNWTAYDILEERECLELAQETALMILGEYGADALSAVPVIVDASKDPNPQIRLAAVEALGKIGPSVPTETSIVPNLIPALVDPDKSVRDASIEAIKFFDCQQNPDPAVTKALEQLSEKLEIPGDVAVNAFAAIGVASVPTLIDILGSGKRVSRQNAAKALGQIGPEAQDSIPDLTEALQDSHPWVQAEAKKSLAIITELKI